MAQDYSHGVAMTEEAYAKQVRQSFSSCIYLRLSFTQYAEQYGVPDKPKPKTAPIQNGII